jgi:hypothetical protein
MEHGAARGGGSSEDDEVAVSIKKRTVAILAPCDDGSAEPEVITRDDKGFLIILALSNS